MTAQFRLLGPVEATIDGSSIALGGAKQKTVLAMLLLAQGRTVSTDLLSEAVWGDDPPQGSIATLRVFVSNLRRAVSAGETRGIRFDSNGYAYRMPHDLDVTEFEELCARAVTGPVEAEPRVWRQALARFRGDPLSGLEPTEPVRREQVRLAEAKAIALDGLFAAELANGRHREVLPELFAASDEQPLREQLRGALMVALYRSGRHADALRSYQQFRQHLIGQLGIEPSATLRALEQQILDQAPELLVPSVAPRRAASTVDVRSAPPVTAHLELEDGNVVPLLRRVTVLGRDDTCDVCILDSRVSRQHAVIRVHQGRFEITDDASTNGTEVNGLPADRHELLHADIISLGGFRMKFVR